MTDFMTALPVILVQRTYPSDQRAKGVQFLSTCKLCRESHKTQVWLCFLVLSFLSTSTCAALVDGSGEVSNCLNSLKSTIEKSDAMLYAPSINEVENCKMRVLRCYMWELIMVLNEEEIKDTKANCIFDFNERLPDPDSDPNNGCPPCEAYALKNITIFLDRLFELLEMYSTMESSQH